MKTSIFISLSILLISVKTLNAQTVDNVVASIQDKEILVKYNIKNAPTGQTFDIELWYSVDNSEYRKCQSVAGSDGTEQGITAGYNKTITWNVLQDLTSLEGNTVDFEVRALVAGGANTPDLTGKKGSFKDTRDSKSYKWIKVGNQIIMAENLAFQSDRGAATYGNKLANLETHGYLYDWKTALVACPTGWRLPSKEELELLLDKSGGSGPNAYASLEQTGFNFVLSGFKSHSGGFADLDVGANYWTKNESSGGRAWVLRVYKKNMATVMKSENMNCGFSVRCLKNQ